MGEVDRAEATKRMVALLQRGAAMLSEACPACGLPLFRLKSGEVVCPVHGRVVIVSSDEEARDVEVEEVVKRVEYEAARNLASMLGSGLEPEEALAWLRVIEEAERILSIRSERRTVALPGEAMPSQRESRRRGS